jgi:hypothetical protein
MENCLSREFYEITEISSLRGAAGDEAISLLIHGELNFGEGFIGLDEIEELDSLGIEEFPGLQLPEDAIPLFLERLCARSIFISAGFKLEMYLSSLG